MLPRRESPDLQKATKSRMFEAPQEELATRRKPRRCNSRTNSINMTKQEYINHHTEASVELLAEIILTDPTHLYLSDDHWIPKGKDRIDLLNVLLRICVINSNVNLFDRISEIIEYLEKRLHSIDANTNKNAKVKEMEYSVTCMSDIDLIYNQNREFKICAAVSIRFCYLRLMKDEIISRFDCSEVVDEEGYWTFKDGVNQRRELTVLGNKLLWN